MIMMLAFLLSIFMIALAFNLHKESIPNMKKNFPFECGFNSMINSRLPFSLQFFMIALIFIIFDIEIILIFPIPLSQFSSLMKSTSTMILMLALLLGILHEWNQGSLSWQ